MTSLLRDDEKYQEVMLSFLHAAESFTVQVYVTELLKVYIDLEGIAPEWSEVILVRLLNNSSTKSILAKAVLNASKDVKDVILDVCNRLNEMDSTFLAQTIRVIAAAKN